MTNQQRLAQICPELVQRPARRRQAARVTWDDVETINDLTADNDHTRAAQLLAKVLGEKKYAKVLGFVVKIHETMGFMPPFLGDFRGMLLRELYNDAKKTNITTPNGEVHSVYDLLD
jgi:hypothetical protein